MFAVPMSAEPVSCGSPTGRATSSALAASSAAAASSPPVARPLVVPLVAEAVDEGRRPLDDLIPATVVPKRANQRPALEPSDETSVPEVLGQPVRLHGVLARLG